MGCDKNSFGYGTGKDVDSLNIVEENAQIKSNTVLTTYNYNLISAYNVFMIWSLKYNCPKYGTEKWHEYREEISTLYPIINKI